MSLNAQMPLSRRIYYWFEDASTQVTLLLTILVYTIRFLMARSTSTLHDIGHVMKVG